jgi:hypothetical protein
VAENNPARLDHRQPLPQAELRRVGPGWDGTAPHLSERSDGQLYHVLHQPAWAPPSVPEPPAPPAPSEPALRTELAVALEGAANADALAQRAEEIHQRAEQHINRCRQQVADFIGLDSELAEVTATALRDGADPALPDVLASKLTARDRARTELAAAESAAAALLAERTTAARAAGEATKAVDTLTVRILAFAAERIAQEAQNLQAEAQQRRRTLLGFDKLTANRPVHLPLAVRAVLGATVDAREVMGADAGPWRRAMDALRANPMAVAIELTPAAVPPLPVQQPQPGDDGDPFLVPVAEQG